MVLLSDIYDVTLKKDNRGASALGWVRPTIGEYYSTVHDFKHVAKNGNITRSFLSTNTDDYILNNLTCSDNVLALPSTATTRSFTPVRERVYLNSAWGRTNDCNTPSAAPGGATGQFGTLTIGVEKASGSTVPLIMLRHRGYIEGNGMSYRLYSSSIFLYYLKTDYILLRTVVTADGIVTGKMYLYSYLIDGLEQSGGIWLSSNNYQLASTDKLYIQHSDYARSDYVYGAGIPLSGIDVLAYTANTDYIAETAAGSTIDNISYVTIDSLTFNYSQPSYCTIKALVSFDGKNTWKRWNGSTFVEYSDVSTGNTLAEMSTGFSGLTMNHGASVDFKFCLKTTNTYYAPSITSYTLIY